MLALRDTTYSLSHLRQGAVDTYLEGKSPEKDSAHFIREGATNAFIQLTRTRIFDCPIQNEACSELVSESPQAVLP